MKVVNTIKLKEEVDYEILYKKMEREVDQLTSEMERQQKVIRSEKMQMDKRLKESERSFHDLRMTFNMQIEVSFKKCLFPSPFSLFLFLVSSCWVLTLAYPNLLGTKRLC
jgi:hypothetical protein